MSNIQSHKWVVNPDDAYVCDNDCGAEYNPHDGEVAPAGPCPATALDANGKLSAIRDIFAGFNWETDDRQYALEAIERIVES